MPDDRQTDEKEEIEDVEDVIDAEESLAEDPATFGDDYVEGEDVDVAPGDLSAPVRYDPEHGDEQTEDYQRAIEEGHTYEPPTDPPIRPSEEPDDAEMAAGWAPAMEETDPDVRDLPDSVDDSDLELEEDVRVALRNNSETAHLTDILVGVRDRVVYLQGTVDSDGDIARVYEIVSDLDGVAEVRTGLEVAKE